MRILPLVVVVLLLAGCASSSSPSSTSSTSASGASSSASIKPVVVVPPTDTLHFLANANLTAKAPKSNGDPNQTALAASGFGPGGGGGQGGGTNGRWEHPLAADETFAGYEAHIWVRVTDQLVAAPDSPFGCAWSLGISVRAAGAGNNQGSSKVQYTAACSGPAGPTIQPGDYELVFHADAPNSGTGVAPGDVLRLQLARTGTSPTPNNSVVVLSGTTAFDSRVTFSGLKEPGT